MVTALVNNGENERSNTLHDPVVGVSKKTLKNNNKKKIHEIIGGFRSAEEYCANHHMSIRDRQIALAPDQTNKQTKYIQWTLVIVNA